MNFDPTAHTLHVQAQFSGLLSPTTASHIHACTPTAGTGTAGVATAVPTFPGFPLGVTSGTYDRTFNTLDLASYNPAFVSANGGTAASAEAVLASCLAAGRAYFNIHTSQFPNGEIRGFLLTTAQVMSNLESFLNGLQVSPGGVGNSLSVKLTQGATCERLGALSNEASAQSGKKITVAQANQIMANVALIRIAQGC